MRNDLVVKLGQKYGTRKKIAGSCLCVIAGLNGGIA